MSLAGANQAISGTTSTTSAVATGGAINYAAIGVGFGVVSAIATYNSGVAASYGYKSQAIRAAQAGKQAKTDSKLSALRMSQRYNEVAANQAAVFSSQGRSFTSGSIQNMIRVDQENLQWDLDYNKLAGDIGALGVEADVQGYESAARQAQSGALSKGLLQAGQTYIDYKRIK
jgi:hypothetical protein